MLKWNLPKEKTNLFLFFTERTESWRKCMKDIYLFLFRAVPLTATEVRSVCRLSTARGNASWSDVNASQHSSDRRLKHVVLPYQYCPRTNTPWRPTLFTVLHYIHLWIFVNFTELQSQFATSMCSTRTAEFWDAACSLNDACGVL